MLRSAQAPFGDNGRPQLKRRELMNNDRFSRRDFMRNTSLAAAGTVAGALASQGNAAARPVDTSKILNFHEKMTYRRMGKTNLMVSEVSLGGHWKNRNAGRYWDSFANEQVPADVAKNRTDVVSACIESGINYLDITTAAECLCYGEALKGRREKMYVGADIHNLGPRGSNRCNVKDQTFNVETCLRLLKTDYLDIWRPQAKMAGKLGTSQLNTDPEVESLIETFQKLHKQGKVRHLGMSCHCRPWFEHVLNKYSEFEMIIFPCRAKTKVKGQAPTAANTEEVNPGHRSDQTQSIFKVVLEKDDQALLWRQSLRERRQGQVPRDGCRQQEGKRYSPPHASMYPRQSGHHGIRARIVDGLRSRERRESFVHALAWNVGGRQAVADGHYRAAMGQSALGVRVAA
jgi:aryl-alcohol dehydrogenase-like predicted oxidoreductase